MTSTNQLTHRTEIDALIARGAVFVVNHSGGKDSQAMFIKLRAIVPADQLVVVHADLPDVDWQGTLAHIEATIGATPLHVTTAASTFFQMVERRGMFPSPKYRQCTSDLKRTPIDRTIRRLLKDRGELLVVSCQGLRADESSTRAKATTFKLDKRNSKAGREWYTWLPIHTLTEADVFATIAAAGQSAHWAYAAGMTRLSCCFCIMASQADLTTAARLNPDLYRRYVETERRLDQSMLMPAGGVRRFLPEITGIEIDNAETLYPI